MVWVLTWVDKSWFRVRLRSWTVHCFVGTKNQSKNWCHMAQPVSVSTPELVVMRLVHEFLSATLRIEVSGFRSAAGVSPSMKRTVPALSIEDLVDLFRTGRDPLGRENKSRMSCRF